MWREAVKMDWKSDSGRQFTPIIDMKWLDPAYNYAPNLQAERWIALLIHSWGAVASLKLRWCLFVPFRHLSRPLYLTLPLLPSFSPIDFDMDVIEKACHCRPYINLFLTQKLGLHQKGHRLCLWQTISSCFVYPPLIHFRDSSLKMCLVLRPV